MQSSRSPELFSKYLLFHISGNFVFEIIILVEFLPVKGSSQRRIKEGTKHIQLN